MIVEKCDIINYMKKKLIIVLISLIIILVIAFVVYKEKTGDATMKIYYGDPLSATYTIDDAEYLLRDGKSEMEAAPGSAEKITTEIFGEPVSGDLNGDGIGDYAMFLVQRTGGTGSFYFVVSAISRKDGKVAGTNAVYLGDRIAPQNIQVKDGEIIANYADRNEGERMNVKPSLGVSKYIKLVDGVLKDVNEKVEDGLGDTSDNPMVNCDRMSGIWYGEEGICEANQLSYEECIAQGGQFDGCASACRHNPKAEVCIMVCVQTCTFR
jgi:hypothetical protein